MQVEDIDHMFNFAYEKASTEITDKAAHKRGQILAKIEERKGRIKRLRAEYGITDEVLIDLLQQARADARTAAHSTYTSKARNTGRALDGGATEGDVIVPAGIVSNIMTEQDSISGELEQAAKLDLVIRNLVDLPDERAGMAGKLRGHRLTAGELVYLGF